MLGASGAVVAVIILYALYFPKRRLLMMFVVPMPAWGVALVVILIAVVGAEQHVAHDVHLAGAALAAVYFYSGARLTGWGGRRRHKLRVVSGDSDSHSHSHDPDEDLEAEGDRLLEKVHREGEASLTAKERKTLERYSRYMRRQRGGT